LQQIIFALGSEHLKNRLIAIASSKNKNVQILINKLNKKTEGKTGLDTNVK